MRVCVSCGAQATGPLVKERVAGSIGLHGCSFRDRYHLCDRCIERVRLAGGVEQTVYAKRYRYIVVAAKTAAWLRSLKDR